MAIKAEGDTPGSDYDSKEYWRIKRAVEDVMRDRDAGKYGGERLYQPFTNTYRHWDTTTHSAKEDGA